MSTLAEGGEALLSPLLSFQERLSSYPSIKLSLVFPPPHPDNSIHLPLLAFVFLPPPSQRGCPFTVTLVRGKRSGARKDREREEEEEKGLEELN